jgi:uncharacterized protein (TIGR03663 family)
MTLGTQAPAPPTQRRFSDTERRLAWFIVAILGVGFVLRIADLGSRALHHDESLDAWFSWRFLEGTYEGYDPVYHGPFRFFVTAGFYWLFDDSVETARLISVLAGTALIALPWLLRRELGVVGTGAAAVALAVSPSFLYYSRFAREDALTAAVALAIIVAIVAYVREPRPWLPSVMAALLAVSFAVKESTYLFVFMLATFLLTAVAAQAWREARRLEPELPNRDVTWPCLSALTMLGAFIVAGNWFDSVFVLLVLYGLVLIGVALVFTRAALVRGATLTDIPLLGKLASVGLAPWLIALGVFVLSFEAYFTVWFTNGEDWTAGVTDALRHWNEQQDVNRGGQPWYYYLYLLPVYEWLFLGLAFVGSLRVWRRRDFLGSLLVWLAFSSVVIYSYAGERMPWLALHMLLPVLLLAGMGVQVIWNRRRTPLGQVVAAVVALGLLGTVVSSYHTNFTRDNDPRELLSQAGQATPDVPATVERYEELAQLSQAELDRPVRIAIDNASTWPWPFYLRDATVSYFDASDGEAPDSDIVIITSNNNSALSPQLTGYDSEFIRHRWWWVPDYNGGWVSGWADYMADRTRLWNASGLRVWNPEGLGSVDEYVYVRADLAALETEAAG